MERSLSRVLVTLLAFGVLVRSARAEVPVDAPPPPDCAANPNDPRCRQPLTPPNPVAPGAPAESGGSGSVGSVNVGSCGGGGGNGGVVILAAAVVAAAFLPVVVFLVDDDASPEARTRWSSLSGQAFVYGGSTTRAGRLPAAAFAGGRAEAGIDYVGAEASVESAADPLRYGAADATLVFRLPPKDHVELGFAVGAKRLQLDGATLTGTELAVPHRYLFGSVFEQRLALEVRPSVAFNSTDVALSLEAGLRLPLPGPLGLRLGGRVWSFDREVEAGAVAGLELQL